MELLQFSYKEVAQDVQVQNDTKTRCTKLIVPLYSWNKRSNSSLKNLKESYINKIWLIIDFIYQMLKIFYKKPITFTEKKQSQLIKILKIYL